MNSMNIAIIGASGFIGAALLAEVLARGHRVTGLVRHPERLASHPRLTAQQCDVVDRVRLPAQLRGHDAVLVSLRGEGANDAGEYYMKGFRSILQAAHHAGVKRLLVVGGGGSLEVAPGLQLLDAPDFPATSARRPAARPSRWSIS
jgi:putative NADH-flavin reductase